jgi:uncharacterized protein
MLKVKSVVRKSPLNGLGVFADEPIRRGQVVWRFDGWYDRKVPQEVYAALGQADREYMDRFHYEDRFGDIVCTMDDCRFMNHAEDSNLAYVEICGTGFLQEFFVAKRDIAAGEELTIHYADIEVRRPYM